MARYVARRGYVTLGSTCGAGVRGGGGAWGKHSAGPEQDVRARGGGQEGPGPAGATWGQGWVLVAYWPRVGRSDMGGGRA